MKIALASGNTHKIKEISAILEKLGSFTLLTPKEIGFCSEIEETGSTFEANSLIKAKAVSDFCGFPAIADDSGLEVDFLDGKPGVYSARFAGDGCTDEDNNKKLLGLLEGVRAENRTARFVSVITLYIPCAVGEADIISARGECPGLILKEARGNGGFGYDPLFLYQPFDKTFAEMTADEKNSISHRSIALQKFERIFSAAKSGLKLS